MSHQEAAKTTSNGQSKVESRDTEVVPKAKRRQFSLAYKKRILEEVDACSESGQIGSILRREGLYSSHLSTWRRQRERGELNGQSRGRPAKSVFVKRKGQHFLIEKDSTKWFQIVH